MLTRNQLFCGADDFSIYSLRALHALQQKQPAKIASLSVLCKTDKSVDRGLHTFRSPPVKAVAKDLELKLHQIDSFKSWRSPERYNLVVAVSFGLLVPKSILDAAQYGGLNVHPSLLPDLRGSAPIVHALLKRKASTGVSLQTMHPTKFDHGTVLGQSEEVPVPSGSTPDQMIHKLGPLGADLLCKGIAEGAFVPPLKDVQDGKPKPAKIDLAPKISPRDRQIDWKNWTADEIIFRDHVLGDLWDLKTFARCQGAEYTGDRKRITFHGPWSRIPGDFQEAKPGEPRLDLFPAHRGLTMGMTTIDDCVVVPHSATIEGKKKGKGLQTLNDQLRKRRKWADHALFHSDTRQ